jgi:hypothetical protein
MFQKSISIQLVEPVVYIRGGNTNVVQYNNIIRGFVVVHSSRLTVIQDIRLRLVGVAKTLWPEGINQPHLHAIYIRLSNALTIFFSFFDKRNRC